jgi:hypothetical protein
MLQFGAFRLETPKPRYSPLCSLRSTPMLMRAMNHGEVAAVKLASLRQASTDR